MIEDTYLSINVGISRLQLDLQTVKSVRQMVQNELDRTPDEDEYEDIRDYYEDALYSLEDAVTGLESLIVNLREFLSNSMVRPDYNSLKEERIKRQPSFLQQLILIFFAAHVYDKVKKNNNLKRQEREQRRLDDLFWQDAARRKGPDHWDD